MKPMSVTVELGDKEHFDKEQIGVRWGVTNGARHNWKCFLAYENFKVFF